MQKDTVFIFIIVAMVSLIGVGGLYTLSNESELAGSAMRIAPLQQSRGQLLNCAPDKSRDCTKKCTETMRAERAKCMTPAPTTELLFSEDFETGLNGWEGRTDAFEITDKYAKTGTRAILNPDKYDASILRTIGTYPQMTYSCWFYDLLGATSETSCIVTKGAYASSDMFIIGTETEKSKDYYSYFLSPDVNSWGVSTVKRTSGWHNAKFAKHDGITDLYLDGIKIATTANNNDWSKIGVALNNWHHAPGHDFAIFDSLTVTKETTSTATKSDCMQDATDRLLTCIDGCTK